jgi:CDP-diacylglycerol--glycerol-3-phosphate 3-phosphatidyltransferase
MASIYDLKPAFQGLLRPLVRRLAARGVTANQVTLGAMALSVATGLIVAAFPHARALLFLIPVVLFVRMALNAIDGMLAREHDMRSALGAILNEMGDAVSDAALYLPLALALGGSPVLVVLITAGALITEVTGIAAVEAGAPRGYEGPMGKSDRAAVFGLLAVLVGSGIALGFWLNAILAVVLALTIWTVINRLRTGVRKAAAS